MAKSGSIAELRGELAARQVELRKLEARRKDLAKKLDAVDRQMVALAGGAPKRKAKRVAAKRAQRIPRQRGRKTLADYIAKVLAKAKEGIVYRRPRHVMGHLQDPEEYREKKEFLEFLKKTHSTPAPTSTSSSWTNVKFTSARP